MNGPRRLHERLQRRPQPDDKLDRALKGGPEGCVALAHETH